MADKLSFFQFLHPLTYCSWSKISTNWVGTRSVLFILDCRKGPDNWEKWKLVVSKSPLFYCEINWVFAALLMSKIHWATKCSSFIDLVIAKNTVLTNPCQYRAVYLKKGPQFSNTCFDLGR